MHAKKIDLKGKLYLRGKITFALACFTLNNQFMTKEGVRCYIYVKKGMLRGIYME